VNTCIILKPELVIGRTYGGGVGVNLCVNLLGKSVKITPKIHISEIAIIR
jgi:hypothetical protein